MQVLKNRLLNHEIDAKQVFGALEIQRILDCSPTASRAIMSKLREIEAVQAVKGNGQGRYVAAIIG